jgi:polar amino acid transport system permease protein
MDLDRLAFTFFNAEIAREYWPDIIKGFWITVRLGLAVIATGLALGLVAAMIRSFQVRAVNALIVFFADALRALPPLMVIIILFFAFPYAGLPMSAFTATWLSLSLVLGAFAEEIFWAGIISIPKGQYEAARSTGMSRWQTLVHVIVPQAVRLTIPPLTNRTIAITKGTALGSVVALPEILGSAHSASSLAGNPTPLTLGAIAYLVLFIPFVVLGRWVETRFAWRR